MSNLAQDDKLFVSEPAPQGLRIELHRPKRAMH